MVMEFHARVPHSTPDALFTTAKSSPIALYNLERGYQDSQVLHLTLGFEADNVVQGVYSVGVHLVDSAGQLVSQSDSGLPDDRSFGCMGVTLPLENLAAGEYTLQVIIYDWQTGERLAAGDGDFVELARIELPYSGD
jgi:hypothetical protein